MDRPIKTICSRSLSSLPEDQMVFSPACRYSVRFCAMGRDQRPFRGSWTPPNGSRRQPSIYMPHSRIRSMGKQCVLLLSLDGYADVT